jgi:hypothetical protein
MKDTGDTQNNFLAADLMENGDLKRLLADE